MKQYQKAQMIAKNLPTGSYAAGCGEHTKVGSQGTNICKIPTGPNSYKPANCKQCEVTK